MNSLEQNKQRIIKAANCFYNGKVTGMSDKEYDELLIEIRKEDPKFDPLEHVVYTTPRVHLNYKAHFPTLVAKVCKDLTFDELKSKGRFISPKYDGSSLVAFYRNGMPYMIVSRGNDYNGISQWGKLNNLLPEHIDHRIKEVYAELTCVTRYLANGAMNSIELPEGCSLNIFGCYSESEEARTKFMEKYVNQLDEYEYKEILRTGLYGNTPADGACVYDPKNHALFINKIYAVGSGITKINGFRVTFSQQTLTYSAVTTVEPIKVDNSIIRSPKCGNYAHMKAIGVGYGAEVELVMRKLVSPYVQRVVTRSEDFSQLETCYCGKKRIQLGGDLICSDPDCICLDKVILYRLMNWLYINQGKIMNDTKTLTFEDCKKYIKDHPINLDNYRKTSKVQELLQVIRLTNKFPLEDVPGNNLSEIIINFSKYVKTKTMRDHYEYVKSRILNKLKKLDGII